tara:strand:- start:240 stop:1241 length:1002 start_codon:yes stop_codon:yes gene_type:complete
VKNYIIKKISTISESQLFEFYTQVYTNINKSFISNLKWYYRIGYNSSEPIVIIVNNKIIGHAGLIPGEIENQGQNYPIIWFTDFVILPEYRSQGYGEALTNEWMNICPHQITFCNDLSLKVFKKLDWKANFFVSRNIYPINSFKIAPVVKKFGLNIADRLIRYFLQKNLKNISLIHPKKISESIIKNIIKLEKKREPNTVSIVRDENWFRWRLSETPYADDIFFFEDQNEFIIGHVFMQNEIKRLNIIYTNSTNKEEGIFKAVIKWSIENDIDFIWYLTSSFKNSNKLFSIFYKQDLNFAFNTSSFELSLALEKGLSNAQGIDSDIDYIKRSR